VGNVFFLQTIVVPTFGSNGPLWSLANEFWYYMLFPAIGVAARGPGSPRVRALSGLLATVIAGCVGWKILAGFVVWMFGYGCYRITRTERGKRWMQHGSFGVVTFGSFAIALSLARLGRFPEALSDFVVGGAFALFVCFLVLRGRGWGGFYDSTARFLARISYSLYLFHLPPLVLMAAWLGHNRRWSLDFSSALGALGIATVVLGYVFAMYWCFEARTDFVRKKFQGCARALLGVAGSHSKPLPILGAPPAACETSAPTCAANTLR
jgi:peptidoglycan/LPS O-acetylase OafA/YrhL